MTNPMLNRRNLLAMACALAITGCVSVDTPDQGGGGGDTIDPPPPPPPVQSGIPLSPGYFNGRDGSGDKIRAQVKRDGRDFRVQSMKGKNGPERLYRDSGNNVYVASNGYSIQVTSARSFQWNSKHGNIAMND